MIPRGAWLGEPVEPVHAEVWLDRAQAWDVSADVAAVFGNERAVRHGRAQERESYRRALPVEPLWLRVLRMVSL